LFSFMTALSESLPPTVIHDIYSVLILTYLHFSQVRKPILDTGHESVIIAPTLHQLSFQLPCIFRQCFLGLLGFSLTIHLL